jgi:hypothetical protein
MPATVIYSTESAGFDFEEFIFSFNALNASKSPSVDFSDSWLILSTVLPFGADAGFFFASAGAAFSSSEDQVAFKLNTIRLSSFENSSTLKSKLSPTSTLPPSSFAVGTLKPEEFQN